MNDAPASPVNPWMIAPVVALAAFMEIMDISIANVSLPHIAGDLSSSQNESTWVLTSYLVTNAVVMPISGWLSNRFGRKRFFLTCIIGFTLASLLCGLAPNLASLIGLRALQGAAGGGLQPSGQAILADSFPPEKRGMASAIYGIAAVVAPTVGPTLGGWITDNYEWRWIFLINVPVGIALVFLIMALIKEPRAANNQAKRSSVDWIGFGLIGLSLGCLQIVLDRGQDDDWFGSGFVTALALISAAAFVLLIWWELRQESPMVNLRLFGNRDFAVTFGLMLMLGFMLLGSTFLLPAYTQSLMGYRAVDAGMLLTPGGVVAIIMMPIVGKLMAKVDVRLLVAIGLAIGGLSLLWMASFYLDVSFRFMMMTRMVQAVALGFLFVPLNVMAFKGIEPAQTNNASALINLARNFGGSIGISFASTLLTRREQFHQSRLVESVQPLNGSYSDYAAQLAHQLGTTPDSAVTMASLYQQINIQSTLLSYLEDFKVVGLIFLTLIPLLLLVRPGKGGAGGMAH
ncbi:MAG TPA: DHA2 family efflux MFS transporter permease subunit [Steroidobacteraceae bacterium]|jgi:DHA2 family multidrug resistance protein|nr:DHA2 family efflux MFS transporter permease subunit [Steroidobacteraceae bacterium]